MIKPNCVCGHWKSSHQTVNKYVSKRGYINYNGVKSTFCKLTYCNCKNYRATLNYKKQMAVV